MKLVLLLIFMLSSNIGLTQQVDGVRDIIRDPSISRRCKSLIEARNEKIRTHQRLNALLKRSKKLEKIVKKNQVTAKSRVDITKTEITNNIRLTKLRIKTMEENIVRKGCPGISL
tara:strand:+ start:300 stop:644 length:345 start_codon:yes stop_codon:yes gene_type:complete